MKSVAQKMVIALGTKEDTYYIVYSNSSNIVSSFVPSTITQPFFELQTPDFAWKFVWNACRDLCKKKFRNFLKNVKFGKRPFIELQATDSRFWMEVCMDCPNKL